MTAPRETLIVDGYNVIHAWPELKAELTRGPLADARRRLVSLLAEYAAVRPVRITVVFDGPRVAPTHEPGAELIDGVTVVFSGRSGSADHLIERLSYEATQRGHPVMVATSDRLQRDMVRAMGGTTIDARTFEGEVRSALAETAGGADRLRDQARTSRRVEDQLPADVRRHLEALRRGLPPPGEIVPDDRT